MKTRAIVLRAVRYSDTATVVHLFTERFGMVPMVVQRSTRSRSAPAMTQPLTQLVVDCEAPGPRMQRMCGAEIEPAYASIPFSPAKSAVAMFLSEFLWAALREEQASEALYEFVALSLQWLDEAEDGYANFHLIFLLQLTRHLGYDPSLLPEAQQLQMSTLMRHNYRTMRLLPLNGDLRSHYLRLLIGFCRENMPSFPEMKSLDILTEIF